MDAAAVSSKHLKQEAKVGDEPRFIFPPLGSWTSIVKNMDLFLFCVYVYLHAHICTTCTRCAHRPEEGAWTLNTEVTDSHGPPCGCWEPNSSSLKEQPLLLTAEVSLQPLGSWMLGVDKIVDKMGAGWVGPPIHSPMVTKTLLHEANAFSHYREWKSKWHTGTAMMPMENLVPSTDTMAKDKAVPGLGRWLSWWNAWGVCEWSPEFESQSLQTKAWGKSGMVLPCNPRDREEGTGGSLGLSG